MTSDDASTHDPATSPEHPAGSDAATSAGEVLSDEGPQSHRVLGSPGTSGEEMPRPDTTADERGWDDEAEDDEPVHSAEEYRDAADYSAEEIVEDAIDFFDGGEPPQSPASDADAPAPG